MSCPQVIKVITPGPPGPAGPTGPAGIGSAWLQGEGTPGSGVGSDGDYYLDTETGDIYGPKIAGAWSSVIFNIAEGQQGPAGPTGATGAQGPAGPDGRSLLSGTSAPSTAVGTDGDFFINTTTSVLYGPKAGGAWPGGISLIGPTGPIGATGPTGPTGPQGPAGADGVDGATGPQGPQGPQGETGPAGPTGPAGADGADGADATYSDATPQALGTAAAGVAEEASRADHVHDVPDLGDLGDVDLATATPTGGDALIYDAGEAAWVPGPAGAAAAGAAGELQYNDGAGGLGASSDLSWDDSAKALGVGGDINLDDGGSFTTTVQCVTPTADRTISFPDATGTVGLVAGSSGQLISNQSGAYAGVSGSSVDGSGNITIGTRWISSLSGAADAPPVALTGTWFTGGTATTTKPQVLIEPTGTTSTAWSTSGTGLGVNAPSGFAGNLLDLQLNGASRFVVGHAFIARQNPDGTTTGGNTRGAGAVDLASGRTAAGNVASGANSFMAATTNGRATGERSVAFQNSVASGTDSFAAVSGAEASGTASLAMGVLAKAQAQQTIVFGDGIASADSSIAFGYGTPRASGIRSFALNWGATTPNLGQFGYGFRNYGAQWTMMGLIGQSTESTAVELLSEGVSGYRAVLPANTTWAGTAMIAARTRNGTSNATFQRQVMIKRDGSNNTTLVGSVQTLGTDIKSNADFDATVTITADDTNESLKVEGAAKVGGTVSSITSSGTTCTVTMNANHGLLTGDYVTIAGAVETQYNGTFTITKTSDTEFTYTAATTPSATPATGTLTANITCRWVCKLDLVQITHGI